MKVEFNNIRKYLISEYTDLCMLLNSSIEQDEKVVISVKDAKAHMDNLRMLVGIIAATEIKGREEFKAVGETELPLFKIPE
jgi:hypothetical protein